MENASDSYGNNPALTKQDCSEKSCRCNRGCCSIGPTGPTEPVLLGKQTAFLLAAC
jgi:hypothetical protein